MPEENVSRVAVILLNWNSYDLVRDCLRSLRAATYPDLRSYVIDNGSRDVSELDRLTAEFPEVTGIRLPENVGFARACNVGIKRALSEGVAHIVLLNSDTEVEPGFAEPLVAAAERDPRIGAVTGKIYYFADRKRIWCAGGDHHWMLGNCELGVVLDRWRPDLAVHGHAHLGNLRGQTPGGVPVRNVAMPVVGNIYLATIETRREVPSFAMSNVLTPAWH